eukprot:TRINITY_DN8410_c0_g1_i2.p1 TRINITY_DN8410_c0_g1~~TRINITY_DN8410_c0_g1_i2.p1  ORF type:complete len:453 (-),score=32.74 TRINITY_DN8410_c0_g1_i2:637-1956(-)
MFEVAGSNSFKSATVVSLVVYSLVFLTDIVNGQVCQGGSVVEFMEQDQDLAQYHAFTALLQKSAELDADIDKYLSKGYGGVLLVPTNTTVVKYYNQLQDTDLVKVIKVHIIPEELNKATIGPYEKSLDGSSVQLIQDDSVQNEEGITASVSTVYKKNLPCNNQQLEFWVITDMIVPPGMAKPKASPTTSQDQIAQPGVNNISQQGIDNPQFYFLLSDSPSPSSKTNSSAIPSWSDYGGHQMQNFNTNKLSYEVELKPRSPSSLDQISYSRSVASQSLLQQDAYGVSPSPNDTMLPASNNLSTSSRDQVGYSTGEGLYGVLVMDSDQKPTSPSPPAPLEIPVSRQFAPNQTCKQFSDLFFRRRVLVGLLLGIVRSRGVAIIQPSESYTSASYLRCVLQFVIKIRDTVNWNCCLKSEWVRGRIALGTQRNIAEKLNYRPLG